MKNSSSSSSSITTILLVVLTTYFLLSAEKNKGTLEKKQDKHIMEYPGEWMYNQRAYPANVINTHAIKNAESRVKEQKEARNAAGL